MARLTISGLRMGKSPTLRLLTGLLVTLCAVTVYSWYTLVQLSHLRELQTDIIDRNRRDSLQLLRMQNDLSQLGLALRDMVQGVDPYGLLAYENELAGRRADLVDAFRVDSELLPDDRSPEQQQQLDNQLQQFWRTTDQMFSLARQRKEREARQLAASTLSAQQSTISNSVSRLLYRNNEAEERAAARIAAIYRGVERNIYAFLTAVLVTIAITTLYLIYSNRRIFAALESLSQHRRVLAAKLITMQEEVLRSVSRELHDEFGQILTAVGAMLGRAEKKGVPPDSPLRAELTEVRQITQETLEKMRGLSQMLHPAVLDDYGLVKGLDWYTQLFQKQTGIETTLDVSGDIQRITGQPAIHCFRIVQEALNNAAKHANTQRASITMEFEENRLVISIRDYGTGIVHDRRGRTPGLGLIAMQERAEMLRGHLEVEKAAGDGTVVRLTIPLPQEQGQAYLTQNKQEEHLATHD